MRKVEMRKERVKRWWASDLEMRAWDAEDERMGLFVEELQPPPLHGLLASRHILYRKSECSHILYAKPLEIRKGEGVVDELESVVPDDDTPDSGGYDAVGETPVACIQTSERIEISLCASRSRPRRV
jgi:hypothetical protein